MMPNIAKGKQSVKLMSGAANGCWISPRLEHPLDSSKSCSTAYLLCVFLLNASNLRLI